MSALALFDALKDFGPRSPVKPAALAAAEPLMPATPPVPSTETLLREKIGAAEASLRTSLEAEHLAQLAEMTARHAAEIEALQVSFGTEAGRTVATALGEAEARITALAVLAATRMIGSILSEDVQRRSVDRLALAIREAMADRDTVRIRVRGPQSLFEALRAALGDEAARLDYTETAGFDLSVAIDGDLLETRLGEWSSGLSEILA